MVGAATQTLATQESALQARNAQALRGMELMDKLSGGPEGRALQRQKELAKFEASLDTPERRMAKIREARLKQQQEFYQDFSVRKLAALTIRQEGKEAAKEQQTALKQMQSMAKEIQRAEAKGSAIAPETFDAYAMAAVKSGNGSMVMQYSPAGGLLNELTGTTGAVARYLFQGEEDKSTSVTAWEWLLLRDIELKHPDWDYAKRLERLEKARAEHGGIISGPSK